MARHFAERDVPTVARYWKAIVAAAGAALVIGNAAVAALTDGYGDGRWDASDTTAAAISVATAFGVWRKANAPKPALTVARREEF